MIFLIAGEYHPDEAPKNRSLSHLHRVSLKM